LAGASVRERPSHPEILDFDIVLAAAKKSRAWASRELWSRYSGQVAGYARAKGSSEPDDLTSEVFLTIFSSLASFVGGEPDFRAYLFTIAHRRLVDELRRRSVRSGTIEWSPERDARSVASAEDDAMRSLGDLDTIAMIEALPEAQREVLMLRIVGDLTIEQVAVVVARPVGAVKALQRRALESMRKKIGVTRTLLVASDDGRE
jgi:RNA polymerase sigma factor (sigma-70 family)